MRYRILSPLSYNGTQYAIGQIAELPAEIGDSLRCCEPVSPDPAPTPESEGEDLQRKEKLKHARKPRRKSNTETGGEASV